MPCRLLAGKRGGRGGPQGAPAPPELAAGGRQTRPEDGLPCGPYPAVCTDWRRLQLGGLLDPAHGKGNAAALLVHLQHLYPDDIPDFQHLARVLYIFFA